MSLEGQLNAVKRALEGAPDLYDIDQEFQLHIGHVYYPRDGDVVLTLSPDGNGLHLLALRDGGLSGGEPIAEVAAIFRVGDVLEDAIERAAEHVKWYREAYEKEHP